MKRLGMGAVLVSAMMATVQPGCTAAGGERGTGGDSSDGGGGDLGFGQGGGEDESCADEVFPGELVPVDLHVLLDQSVSMDDSSKWSSVVNALNAFIAAPESGGIGMGLQYFPIAPSQVIPGMCSMDSDCGVYGPCVPVFNVCNGSFAPNDSCDPGDYATAEVGIAELPGVAAAIQGSLAAHSPTGDSTPTQPGFEGAMQYATGWAAANPTHLVFIVLATDGEPTNCNPNSVQGTAAAASAAAAANPSVKTFVIGVGDSLGSLNQIASAGGTDTAYLVDAGPNTTQQFIDALVEIRSQGECQFQIPVPAGGTPDFDRVNVKLVDPNDPSVEIDVFNVSSEAGCDPVDGGWYYDDPANPQTIILCQVTCELVRAADYDIRVTLGCATRVK